MLSLFEQFSIIFNQFIFSSLLKGRGNSQRYRYIQRIIFHYIFFLKPNSLKYCLGKKKVITVTVVYEQQQQQQKAHTHKNTRNIRRSLHCNTGKYEKNILVPCSRHNIFATAAWKGNKEQKTQMNKKKRKQLKMINHFWNN